MRIIQIKHTATPLPQTSHTTALATSTSPMVNCIRKKADRNGKALTAGGLPVPAYLRRSLPILFPSAKRRNEMERTTLHHPPSRPSSKPAPCTPSMTCCCGKGRSPRKRSRRWTLKYGNSTGFENRISQILKDKGCRKFLLLPAKKGIIMRVYPMEGGCHGYLLRPQGYAGTAPFHL